MRQIYSAANPGDGLGISAAVVDCGVGPHSDLTVAGGLNVVRGEDPADIAGNGNGHGTHVAGIIASSVRGIAPAVDLNSFRVVGKAGQPPSCYLITKALIKAWEAGCQIANISFGAEQGDAQKDEMLREGIEDARDHGCVVIAAAGKSGKNPGSLRAKYVSTAGLAVTAMGRRSGFPPGSLEESDIEAKFVGSDPDDFIAAFSSFGTDVSVTAPGVGIISTVPNGGYRPESGTSMAAHDRTRAGEVLTRIVKRARRLGFPREREGAGIPC